MPFSDIKGQTSAINILKSCLAERRLSGGYLFCGPAGIGKKFTAITLAKALNCLNSQYDACGVCPSCKRIDANQHPDVHIIDADTPIDSGFHEGLLDPGGADALKIGHIRQLQKEISLGPYEGKTKVFIIDNAHNLTAAASNALLKILEEPPKSSLIILISDKLALLFKTIISRCKMVKFSPLKRQELKGILRANFGVDNDNAHFLAYFSEGRIGKALELKETDIVREKNRVIDTFTSGYRLNIDEFLIKNREEVRRYLNMLATWYRDIYLLKIGMNKDETINFDRRIELLRLTDNFTFDELNQIMDAISNSIFYLERNVNTRLLLYNLGAELWRG